MTGPPRDATGPPPHDPVAGRERGPFARTREFVELRTAATDAGAGFEPANVAQHRVGQLFDYRARLEEQRGADGTAGLAAAPPPSANWIPLGPLVSRGGQGANKPMVSGRVSGIAVSNDGMRVYVASANGGVWRSTDRGRSWRGMTDEFDVDPTANEVDSQSCGHVALVDGGTADQDLVYVGTGEGWTSAVGGGSSTAYLGVGPIVSRDGGRSWTAEPAAPSLLGHAFFRLAVDPADPDNVVAATTNGVYRRSVTGGVATWNQEALPPPGGTECSAVVAVRDGATTRFFLARTGSGVLTSTSAGGVHGAWTVLGAAFPTANVGRISLAATGPPVVVYAVVAGAAPDGFVGMYRLDLADAPQTWREIDDAPSDVFGRTDHEQGSYDQALAVDPTNPDRLYVGGSTEKHGGEWAAALYRCDVRVSGAGAARTYSMRKDAIGGTVHADVHTFATRPGSDELWVGCDGGVFLSEHAATSDEFVHRNTGLNTMTLVGLAHHPDFEAWAFCGAQDNGGLRYDGAGVWTHQLPGDGGATVVDWNDPTRFLNIYIRGTVRRVATDGARYSYASADVPLDASEGVLFYPPMAGVPRDQLPVVAPPVAAHAARVAFGSRRVWVSDDFGSSWTSLTTNAWPADDLGVLVQSLAFSSFTRLWVGTRDGQVIEYNQGGAGWASTNHGRPNGFRPVTSITPDPADATGASIFVTLGGGPGTTRRVWHWPGAAPWAHRSTNLLDTQHNALVVDPASNADLYVGADIGVWHSADSGATWNPLSPNLPDAAVLELDFHAPSRLLRATTHGRGVWEMPVPRPAAPQPGVHLLVRTNALESGRRPAPVSAPGAPVFAPTAPDVEIAADQSPDIRLDPPDSDARYRVDPTAPMDLALFSESLSADESRLLTAPAGVTAVTRAYVQLQNMGVTAADGVRVMLLAGTPAEDGTLPDLPAGIHTSVRAGTPVETPEWRTLGIRTVDGAGPGRPAVAGFDVRSDAFPPSGDASGDRALVALVHHPADEFPDLGGAAAPADAATRRHAALRMASLASARGAAASGAAGGSAGPADPGVSVLTPAAVALLAHARLGDAVDGLTRKVNATRVQPALGGFPGRVVVRRVERQVLALATTAQEMFRDGSATDLPVSHPLAGAGRFALLGAMGLEIPGYAGLLRPGGGWVADYLRRGTPDPDRSLVAVPAARFALRAGKLALDRATTDDDRRKIRAFGAGALSAVASGIVVAPQLRDLLARDTNLDWERWRRSTGARAVDEMVRTRLFAGRSGAALGSWWPPVGEVPGALWDGYLDALREVYALPDGRRKGFKEFEDRFDAGDWLNATRLANAYEVFRQDLGTSSWPWYAWWGLLTPILLGPSVALLSARLATDGLPNANRFTAIGANVDERSVFELVQLGFLVGSVSPFVYSMLLWIMVDEHTEAFVNALVLFVARAVLGGVSLGAADDLDATARWLGLFAPMAAGDVYAAIRAIVGAASGRPGVATVFGINTIPALTSLASLAFGGLFKAILDASEEEWTWWLSWGLLTAVALFAVGIPVAVALSRGGGIWSWFLRRDARFPLVSQVTAAGSPAREPVARARAFDDSTLWVDPDNAPPAAPDLSHLDYPSGMRPLVRVWWEGEGTLEINHDGRTIRLRPSGGAEATVHLPAQGVTAERLALALSTALAGVSAEPVTAGDPMYRLPWPRTLADPGDTGPRRDHVANRARFLPVGTSRKDAIFVRHTPRIELASSAGAGTRRRGASEEFPVVPGAGLGDVESTGLGVAADLAALLTLAAAPTLTGGTVTVPGLAAPSNTVGPVEQVFRRWNLDERRVNEWRMVVSGRAGSEKRTGEPDPLLSTPAHAGPPGTAAGEPFATAMGWVPLWRAWLRVATDPGADVEAAIAMPYTPVVTLPDAVRRPTNAELTLGVRFLLDLS